MSKALKKESALLRWADPGQLQLENVEASNTIIQKVCAVEGLYLLDALTEKGWLRTFNFEARPEERDKFLYYLATESNPRKQYRVPRATSVVAIRHHGTRGMDTTANDDESELEDAANEELEWLESPVTLLERLQDNSITQGIRQTAILFAETTVFDDSLRPRLLSLLNDYISTHRFADDDDTITTLGSAIRKYAMNMDESLFDSYAEWLKPSQTETLHHSVELELAKGACWRLTYEPVESGSNFPELKSAIFALADDYVTPRLILQKNYASIALNATIAVILLDAVSGDSECSRAALRQVAELGIDWFAELLERRLFDAVESVEFHSAEVAIAIQSLIAGAAT